LRHGLVGEERVILEHEPETAFVGRRVAQILPLPEHRAGLGFFETGNDAQNSALARSGSAQKADELPFVHRETDAFEQRLIFVIFDEVLYFEHQNNSSPGRRIFSMSRLPSPQTSSSKLDIAKAYP